MEKIRVIKSGLEDESGNGKNEYIIRAINSTDYNKEDDDIFLQQLFQKKNVTRTKILYLRMYEVSITVMKCSKNNIFQ